MRFFIPFFDDSSVIFAAATKPKLEARGHDVITALMEDHTLSERQLTTHMPGADMNIDDSFFRSDAMNSFDAMLTCKAPLGVRKQLADRKHRARRNRPAYIAFQPGLEFTPERGRLNRLHFDAVFLYSAEHRDAYNRHIQTAYSQHVSFGHPYFITPNGAEPTGSNVYFFAQAISPMTLSSRQFMVDVLATLARRHPNRDVIIKLRHLPGENSAHVHKEAFAYPWIIDRYFRKLPPNLKLTDCSMKDALADAAFAITCTSTAVMDAISANVPAMIYLDYIENHKDKYAGVMRKEFGESNLITPLTMIMDLVARSPAPDWMSNHFRGDDLFDEIETFVAEFKLGGL